MRMGLRSVDEASLSLGGRRGGRAAARQDTVLDDSSSCRPRACSRGAGVVVHRETAVKQTPNAAAALLLVERPTNLGNRLQRDSSPESCGIGSLLALPLCPSASSSVSSSTTSCATRRPVFCSPYYRWAPLHTAYSSALVNEHESVIQWYEQQQQQQQHSEEAEEEIIDLWLATAKSRSDALRLFVQRHRVFYGTLDEDKLQLVEDCQKRLLQCVERAQTRQRSRLSSSTIRSCLAGARSAGRPFATRAKHISFATPLFKYFSTTPSTREGLPSGSLSISTASAFTYENNCYSDEVYTGRTSGVFYGNTPDALLTSTVCHQRREREHVLEYNTVNRKHEMKEEVVVEPHSYDSQQQKRGDLGTGRDDEKTFGDSYPHWLLSSSATAGTKARRHRQRQRRRMLQLYIVVLAICCLPLLVAMTWWW